MTTWRYLAQRAVTREFVHTDLPFRVEQAPSQELSAVGSFRASLAPDVYPQLAEDGKPILDEWGTLIYAEADGVIRWGGILISSTFDVATARWQVEAASFATYPHGIPYEGAAIREVGVPAGSIFARLWAAVQSGADSDLGVVVRDSTGGTNIAVGARLGTADDPYELSWEDAPDLGRELDRVAQDGLLDWTEHHTWNADKSDVHHEIRVHYPRAGRTREDLTFRTGENIVSVDRPTRGGDEFANAVVGIGAGEGEGSLRRTTGTRDGRLRRPHLLMAKDVATPARLDSMLRTALLTRQNTLKVPGIMVRDHPNAPLGSWALGDDILVQADVPWLGRVDLRHRVVAWEPVDDETAHLSLERSDSFTYGG